MTHAYMPGHAVNNAAAVVHVVMVVLILLAGALQVIPQVRRRAPSFHRWNGRAHMVAAFVISLTALWMLWVRGTGGSPLQKFGLSLNAVAMLVCAVMTVRHAMARRFAIHRRWALRLFLVVNGVWFFRVCVYLSFVIFGGPFGFNPRTFEGPFLTFLTFAAFLVPLAVLELYLRAQDRPVPARQLAMAGCLAVLTVAMGAGSALVTVGVSAPAMASIATDRTAITEALSVTIASDGVDTAIRQYRAIAARRLGPGGDDEGQIDSLGYELIRSDRLHDAIRILQVNVGGSSAIGQRL